MPKIAKRSVDAFMRAGPDVEDRWLWDEGDGALKGFGVRMSPTGVASYLVQYRNLEGDTRRLVLGRVTVLTPDQAREAAEETLYKVKKGQDPSAERRKQRNALTVGEMCDWYHEGAAAGRILGRKGRPIKASTLALDRSRIERHIKPLIGRRAASAVTEKDIRDLQADIAAGKTARPRPAEGRAGVTKGGRGVAARTLRMLAAIFEHGRRDGLVDNNPVRGVRRFADGKRKRALSLDELAALGKAMRETYAEGKSPTGIAVARALALTGCRKTEILALTCDQFDPNAHCIRFADTKSGPDIRPLGAAAVRHLVHQTEHAVGVWMFPADRGGGHFVGVRRVLKDLCAGAGLSGVTPHTLRHTFASVAGSLNYSKLTIAGLLGHAARGVTEDYVHLAPDDALLAAANAVAARIAAALDGTAGAKVLPMRRGKTT
jgi:integrase